MEQYRWHEPAMEPDPPVTEGLCGTVFRIFKYTATNSILEWSDRGHRFRYYIDPFIVKLGATYHLFAKGPTYIEAARFLISLIAQRRMVAMEINKETESGSDPK